MTGEVEHGTAWRRISRSRWSVFAVAALLLAAGVSIHWRIQSDSALYLGIGRSLAAGEGYTFSGEGQYSIPPVAPLLFSAVWKAGEWASGGGIARLSVWFNALSALVALGGIIVAYYLLREMAGHSAALVAAAFLAVSLRYYGLAMSPLTDTIYCLVSWAALLAFIRAGQGADRRRIAGAAVLIALLPLTRAVGPALVGALAAWAAWRELRGRGRLADLVMIGPGLAVAAAFAIVILVHRGGADFNYWDDLVAGRGAGELLARFGHDLWTLPGNVFEAVVGLESFGGFSFLFLAWLAWGAVAAWRGGARIAVVYTGVYFLWVALGEEVRPRYVVPVLPFLYLFMVEAARLTAARFATRSAFAGRTSRKVLAVLAVLVVALNMVHIGDEIRLSHSDDFYRAYRHGKWAGYVDLARHLDANPIEGRILVLQHRVLHLLSGAPTTGLPYHPETAWRPSNDQIARYIEDRRVTAIVADGDDGESAEILTGFIESRHHLWRYEADFGPLLFFRRENRGASGDLSS